MRVGQVSSEASPADGCWVSSPRAPGGRPGGWGGEERQTKGERVFEETHSLDPTIDTMSVLANRAT